MEIEIVLSGPIRQCIHELMTMSWLRRTEVYVRTQCIFVWCSYYWRWLPWICRTINSSVETIDAIRSKYPSAFIFFFFVLFFASICIRPICKHRASMCSLYDSSSLISDEKRMKVWSSSSFECVCFECIAVDSDELNEWLKISTFVFESLLTGLSAQRTKRWQNKNDDKRITRNRNYALGCLTSALGWWPIIQCEWWSSLNVSIFQGVSDA